MSLCSENTLCSEAPGPADCEGSLCMLAWACPGVESSVGMVMSLWYPEDAREANRPADTKYSIADYSDKLKTQKKKKKATWQVSLNTEKDSTSEEVLLP